MKVYIVSGLGADFKALEKLQFNENIEPVFLDWLMPEERESFPHYVERMAARVDDSEPFYLLGYSFGGIIVQEIHKRKAAEKVVILASIKAGKERSRFMELGRITKIPKYLPARFYNQKSAAAYAVVRRYFDPTNPKLLEYFTVREPYYLKWSVEKIVEWNGTENPETIQIMGDKDIVFPIKNSSPDFVIKGGTHLFPVMKPKPVSKILADIFV